MNEKTEALLEGALMKGLEIAEKTGEFIIEQSPVLLSEFYAWHITASSIKVFLLSIPLILAIRFYSKTKEEGWQNPTFANVMTIIMGVISIFTTFGVLVNVMSLVKVLVAPRLYLIEYFAN